MTRSLRRAIPITLSACILAASALVKGDEGRKLDKGLLDPAWFGPGVEFRTTDTIDYLWAKPGFSIKGRKLHIEKWSDPEFLGERREARDSAKASELTEVMPSRLRGALAASLSGIAEVSRDEGDITVTGRIVDCAAGSKAAKMWVGFGAGKAYATWDIKFIDKATGELLVAVHHRSVSGTSLSEIDDKLAKWLEEFGQVLHDDLAVLASAQTAKK